MFKFLTAVVLAAFVSGCTVFDQNVPQPTQRVRVTVCAKGFAVNLPCTGQAFDVPTPIDVQTFANIAAGLAQLYVTQVKETKGCKFSSSVSIGERIITVEGKADCSIALTPGAPKIPVSQSVSINFSSELVDEPPVSAGGSFIDKINPF